MPTKQCLKLLFLHTIHTVAFVHCSKSNIVSSQVGPDLLINPLDPVPDDPGVDSEHAWQGGRDQPLVDLPVVSRPEGADDDAHHDAPEPGDGRVPDVGHLVQLQVGERLELRLSLGHCGVEESLGAVFYGGVHLGVPGRVLSLSLGGHGTAEAHPHGEYEGGEAAEESSLE